MSLEKSEAEQREELELASIWEGKVFAGDGPLNTSDETFKAISSELDTRSITPTTLRRVEISDTNIDMVHSEIVLVSEVKEKKQQMLVKQAKEECAVPDGIAREFSQITSYIEELEKFKAILDTNPHIKLLLEEKYQAGENIVPRYGINDVAVGTDISSIYAPTKKPEGSAISGRSKGSKKSGKEKEVPHLLHPIEIINIRKAIESLNIHNNKAVLIDIFARLDDGQIRIDESKNRAEIHTVVLYMQEIGEGDNKQPQILIIDPSNSQFSKHLVSNSGLVFLEGAGINPVEILAPPKMVKIYSPASGKSTGPNPCDPRDCTDIAVKIALGLNSYEETINIKDLASVQVIQEITNNTSYNENLFFEAGLVVARARQATEFNIRTAMEKILYKMQRHISSVREYYKPKSSDSKGEEELKQQTEKVLEFKTKYLESLSITDIGYKDFIANILMTYKNAQDLWKGSMDESHDALQGICEELLSHMGDL